MMLSSNGNSTMSGVNGGGEPADEEGDGGSSVGVLLLATEEFIVDVCSEGAV